MKYLFLVCIFYLTLHFSTAETQPNIPNFGRCITPNKERGLCVYLDSCGVLYTLLQKTPLPENEKLFLRRSQCGYNNGKVSVCCAHNAIGPAVSPETSTSAAPSAPPGSKNSLLPQPGTCGSVLLNKIYGGNITKIDEYPWMALLAYSKPGNRKGFHCGGSLINNRYVLTASHCVNGVGLPADWMLSEVRLGEWDLSTERDCERDVNNSEDCADAFRDIAIEKIIPHPEYDPPSKDQRNDIALLRLAQKVTFTDFIKPICLPRTQNLQRVSFQGIKMDVAGWGKTEKSSVSNVKLKATVDGVDLNQCNSVYSQQDINLDNTQLCAGGEEGVDSCRGDSGGPLIALDTTNKVRIHYFIAGVVSFGPTPCGLQGWPGVYTKVGPFVSWIEQNIRA